MPSLAKGKNKLAPTIYICHASSPILGWLTCVSLFSFLLSCSIPIHERVELPEEWIPADSRVEIDAKINAGKISPADAPVNFLWSVVQVTNIVPFLPQRLLHKRSCYDNRRARSRTRQNLGRVSQILFLFCFCPLFALPTLPISCRLPSLRAPLGISVQQIMQCSSANPVLFLLQHRPLNIVFVFSFHCLLAWFNVSTRRRREQAVRHDPAGGQSSWSCSFFYWFILYLLFFFVGACSACQILYEAYTLYTKIISLRSTKIQPCGPITGCICLSRFPFLIQSRSLKSLESVARQPTHCPPKHARRPEVSRHGGAPHSVWLRSSATGCLLRKKRGISQPSPALTVCFYQMRRH